MKRFATGLILAAGLLLAMIACGGGSSQTPGKGIAPGAVFVTGEDTPLPSVLAFNVSIDKITLTDGSNTVTALSIPQTVDFARLVGLRTLLSFDQVAAGTYTSATVTLSSPVISYLDLSQTPPGVGTIQGSFTGSDPKSTTVTVALSRPLVVTSNGLAGLHMEFDLRQSLPLDATGQVTGAVNPQINLKPVAPTDDDAQITDLRGSLVSVNVSGNSFIIQRPGGRQITIDVASSTVFQPASASLSTLTTPAVIEVDGTVQNDGTVLATSVEVVAVQRAYVAGPIINVNPSSGPAQTVTILVTEEFPDQAGVQVGFPLTLDVTGVQDYDIRRVNNWFASFLFNNTNMVVGQRIGIGGTLDTAVTPAVFVPKRIVLRRQGVEGDLVAGSVTVTSGNQGTFQLQNNGLFGFLLGAPLDVSTSNATVFVNVSGLGGLMTGGNMKLVTFGLILKDSTTGKPRMYAHYVRVLP